MELGQEHLNRGRVIIPPATIETILDCLNINARQFIEQKLLSIVDVF